MRNRADGKPYAANSYISEVTGMPQTKAPSHIEVPKKCEMGVFITAPNRAPAETQQSGFDGKRTSDRESESCRLRRDEGFAVRSDDGQHRICLVCGKAAALPNAPGGAWPHTPFSGRNPDPLLATKIDDATGVGSIVLGVRHHHDRSEERRVGKECRSRWSPYH